MGHRSNVALWALLLGLLLLHATQSVTGFGSKGFEDLVANWVYLVVRGLAAAFVITRAVRRREQRLGWALLGAGLATAVVGDLLWTLLYDASTGHVPTPSSADVAYVLGYPLMAAAVVLLVPRERGARSGLWLDGLLAALVAVLLLAKFVLDPMSAAWDDMSGMEIATNVAYPLGDALLLGVLAARLAMREWRMDLRYSALVLGIVFLVVADALYLRDSADGSFMVGPTDIAWLMGSVFWAAAAWLPARSAGARAAAPRGAILMPVVGGLLGVLALATEPVKGVHVATIVLAAAIAATAFARFALTALDNQRLLSASRHDAATDALTGLGNRRALLQDLAEGDAGDRVLVLVDLDGFKLYNDTFGHPAGDVLLTMIGEVLRAHVEPDGRGYRLGGDEFCALLPAGAAGPEVLGQKLSNALVHDGQGFHVGASFGVVALPQEASSPAEALGIVDRRLYACKNGRRGSAGRQSADVLLAVLAERTPELGDHVNAVADLAAAVGARLGVADLELEHLRHAAELHDVGKIAIPEGVLNKPSALDEAEWALMRQHTIIGERVLSVAPALAPVGTLVRSSHERWDGGGYPDGLAGAKIPLGSRVILACDAFDAMTSTRPYQGPMPVAVALEELRHSAGTQLDPIVVDALCDVIGERCGHRLRDERELVAER